MQNIDPTMVKVWKAVSALHTQDEYAFLDQKSRSIIFAVADAELQQNPLNYGGLIALLRPKSQMPFYSRLKQLIREGWLNAETVPNDKRSKTLHLTPKSIAFVNSLSSAIKGVVKTTAAIAALLLAELNYHATSTTLLFAPAFSSI
jgi:hypothetical protein